MVDAGRRMACSSLDSGTEDGMPRAWAFCRGQMPREDGETERTRRRVGDYSGELWRFASAAAEGWVAVRSTGARNRVRLIGEKCRLDKGMIQNIAEKWVEGLHKFKKHVLYLRNVDVFI